MTAKHEPFYTAFQKALGNSISSLNYQAQGPPDGGVIDCGSYHPFLFTSLFFPPLLLPPLPPERIFEFTSDSPILTTGVVLMTLMVVLPISSLFSGLLLGPNNMPPTQSLCSTSILLSPFLPLSSSLSSFSSSWFPHSSTVSPRLLGMAQLSRSLPTPMPLCKQVIDGRDRDSCIMGEER